MFYSFNFVPSFSRSSVVGVSVRSLQFCSILRYVTVKSSPINSFLLLLWPITLCSSLYIHLHHLLSFLLSRCPNYRSLISCIVDPRFVIFNVSLSYSFRMLPHTHRNIHTSLQHQSWRSAYSLSCVAGLLSLSLPKPS